MSFSIHRGVTIVSELRRTTSRVDACIPRFTLCTNPRRRSLRSTLAEVNAATADSTPESCGPSTTSITP
jgi:hypothetical protein